MTTVVSAVRVKQGSYPDSSPYNPSEKYPEYPFPGCIQNSQNVAYDGVRRLLQSLKMDEEHFGSLQWNPLGEIVKPGMTVVLKPNFVRSKHYDGKDLFSIVTHPSVIRAVADYCCIALKGSGRIVLLDGPNFDCDWQELCSSLCLQELVEFFESHGSVRFSLMDIRNYWGKSRVPFMETRHMPSCKRRLFGDPLGVVVANLGERSYLHELSDAHRYYGAVFDRGETIEHHHGERHEYEVSRTIMSADVVISIPKLKVHKRCGVTLNVKGLVGSCTNKNYLVHYRLGSPKEGGDQYPEGLLTRKERRIIGFERWMYDLLLAPRSIVLEMIHRFVFGLLYLQIGRRLGLRIPASKRVYEPGCWHGNNSTWRMAADLVRIITFVDKNGVLHERPQRRLFSIIDGIVGGENKGPLIPDPVPAGVLIGGENLIAVDIVGTRLMGFDPLKIKMYEQLLHDVNHDFGVRKLDDIAVVSDDPAYADCLKDEKNRFLGFKPHPGWVGHIESVGSSAS